MNEIIIPIESVKKEFNDHLEIPSNSRIFFSGKFGVGKTHFLNEFFESKNDGYEVIHLYPVNYQISQNEDIIELIKYDILVELLKRNDKLLNEEKAEGLKDSTLLFYTWCKEKFSINSILQSGVSSFELMTGLFPDPSIAMLGKLGRPLKNILEIDSEFQKFKEEYKKGEKGKIEKICEEIKKKDISETDYFSYLLKEKIIQQKGAKKSVLILDDLDRIDPEHIFRILNILSAYFEKEHENKFGFDAVIIVADYSNIKNIFHHKYGAETDFSGYADKFFSISPYYFDNRKAVINTVDEIVKSIKNEEPELSGAVGDSGYIKLFLCHIFIKAIDSQALNLRELLKITRFQLTEFKKGGYIRNFRDEDQFTNIFNKAIIAAILSVSSIENFLQVIKKIKVLKTERKARLPFERYIQSMLHSFGVEVPNDETIVTWGNYQIKKSSRGIEHLEVVNNREEPLFYDLLASYIESKKYISGNSYYDEN
jgi:hypothetical protein